MVNPSETDNLADQSYAVFLAGVSVTFQPRSRGLPAGL
jgi:hypothetical protein